MSVVGDQVLREQLLERRQRLQTYPSTAAGRNEASHLLHQVDSALERLERGSHGLCGICRAPIEADLLMSDPLVSVCLSCLSPQESRALEHDLETAASIQSALLPTRGLPYDGWDIHYHYEPAGPVSGDHCDLIRPEAADDSLYFFFGDVSGKGVAASLLMAHLQALFRSLVILELQLEEMLVRANRIFSRTTLSSSYATLVAGRILGNGRLEMVNAGHLPPLLVRKAGITEIPSGGLPLGMFPDATFETVSHHLAEDDYLFLYTDGLSEAIDEHGEEYGLERIRSLHRGLRGHAAAVAARTGLDDLASFRNGTPQVDDLTLMVLRRAAGDAS